MQAMISVICVQKFFCIPQVWVGWKPGVVIIRPVLPFDQVLPVFASSILFMIYDGFYFLFLILIFFRKFRQGTCLILMRFHALSGNVFF